jgi:hypothetical protein
MITSDARIFRREIFRIALFRIPKFMYTYWFSGRQPRRDLKGYYFWAVLGLWPHFSFPNLLLVVDSG